MSSSKEIQTNPHNCEVIVTQIFNQTVSLTLALTTELDLGKL